MGINIIILFVIITAGLWPFEFNPENKVRRLPDRDGIDMHGNGLIYEPDDKMNASILSRMPEDNQLGIEIMLTPRPGALRRVSSILCFYDGIEQEIFMIAKAKSDLLLRTRLILAGNRYAYDEKKISDSLPLNRRTLISISMGGKGTAVYIDGKKRAFFPRYNLKPDKEKSQIPRMMIGNNPTLKSPWKGEINGLALYNRELPVNDVMQHYLMWENNNLADLSNDTGIFALYLMNERTGPEIRNQITGKNNMIIPGNLFALKKTVLAKPWIGALHDSLFYYDLLLNFVGFMPLGFFFLAYFISSFKKNMQIYGIVTVVIGACLSLFIELIQVCIPGRTSSITDLIANITGTIAGVLLCRAAYTISRSRGKNGLFN
jgi:hypothetical protein